MVAHLRAQNLARCHLHGQFKLNIDSGLMTYCGGALRIRILVTFPAHCGKSNLGDHSGVVTRKRILLTANSYLDDRFKSWLLIQILVWTIPLKIKSAPQAWTKVFSSCLSIVA